MDKNLEQQSNANLRDPIGTETNNAEISNKCVKAGTLRGHLQEKSNKCNQCDFVSYRARNLRAHLKKHSGEKLNKCNQCDYASARAGAVRSHMKTHTDEKPNKCNECNYSSSWAYNLTTHMKKHVQA